MNMFVIKSCNIKVGVWVRGVNVKWSEASLTCCIWPCFDVFWPGQTAADWDTGGAWTGQWMQWRAVNRLQIMSPAWGSLTFIPPQTKSTRMVSASLYPNRMSNLIQHQKAESALQVAISNTARMTINGGQLLLVNLYSHNSRVSSNCPKVTLIKCVYTFTLVWH